MKQLWHDLPGLKHKHYCCHIIAIKSFSCKKWKLEKCPFLLEQLHRAENIILVTGSGFAKVQWQRCWRCDVTPTLSTVLSLSVKREGWRIQDVSVSGNIFWGCSGADLSTRLRAMKPPLYKTSDKPHFTRPPLEGFLRKRLKIARGLATLFPVHF